MARINRRPSEVMRVIGEAIQDTLDEIQVPVDPDGLKFVLVVFPANNPDVINSITSASDENALRAIKRCFERAEAERHDERIRTH